MIKRFLNMSILLLSLSVPSSIQLQGQQPTYTIDDSIIAPQADPGAFCSPLRSNTVTQLKSIRIRKKLSVKNATIIAEAYFSHCFGACGALDRPSIGSKTIEFPFLVGYTAAPSNSPIEVDRSTGGVSCGGLERFHTVQDFVSHLATIAR